jgi:hypothetical protein
MLNCHLVGQLSTMDDFSSPCWSTIPGEISTESQVLLQYFPGKVLVTPSSPDALRFNRLRDPSHAVNACATCCGALMFASWQRNMKDLGRIRESSFIPI